MQDVPLDDGMHIIMRDDIPVGYKKTHDEARDYMNSRVYEIINTNMFKYMMNSYSTDEAITLYAKPKSGFFKRSFKLASLRIIKVVNIPQA